jgi:hypothetical protein
MDIEYPLVAVGDLEAVAARWQALGFVVGPAVRQPWGTVSRAIGFGAQGIELIAVEDAAAAREGLGGLITDGLKRGEGVAALALRSGDAAADLAAIEARGGWSTGIVETGEASLAVLPDDDFPDLAVVLRQMHGPGPAWPAHPNGANALSAVWVLAPRPEKVAARLVAVWGAVEETPGGVLVQAGGVALQVLDEAALLRRLPGMRLPVGAARRAPCVVALSVHTGRFSATVIAAMQVAGVRVEEGALRRVLVPAGYAGGVILEVCG